MFWICLLIFPFMILAELLKMNKGGYMLVDIDTNCAAAPSPMDIEQVKKWLDDLDQQQ